MTTVKDGLALVLTDYPLKSIVYKKMCEACFPNLNVICATDPNEMRGLKPEVVLVDLNVMTKDEPALESTLLNIFNESNIVLLEEDHEEIEIKRNNSDLLITIGKRTEKSRLEAILEMLASFDNAYPLSKLETSSEKDTLQETTDQISSIESASQQYYSHTN